MLLNNLKTEYIYNRCIVHLLEEKKSVLQNNTDMLNKGAICYYPAFDVSTAVNMSDVFAIKNEITVVLEEMLSLATIVRLLKIKAAVCMPCEMSLHDILSYFFDNDDIIELHYKKENGMTYIKL